MDYPFLDIRIYIYLTRLRNISNNSVLSSLAPNIQKVDFLDKNNIFKEYKPLVDKIKPIINFNNYVG